MTANNLLGFENLPQTIPHYCLESFRRNDKQDALCFKSGDVWQRLSGKNAIDRVRQLALGLASFGIQAGDKVAIISENRPEWSLTDIALLCLRAVNVPIYTTQAVDQIRFILENSGAKMLLISGKKLYKHAAEAIEKIVFFDTDEIPDQESRAVSLDDVKTRGDELHHGDERAFQELLDQVRSDDLATIIYTSGT